MEKIGRKYCALFAAALFAVCPFFVQAQITLPNPLQYDTIEALIAAILAFLRNLAITVTALVIVVAGYMFVTSMGDPQKVTNARRMVIYSMVGLAVILVAEGIVALIRKIIGVE